MTDSPLPELKPIRLAVMSAMAGIYFLVVVGFWFFYDGYDVTEALMYIGGCLSGMWILQWIVLAGQARPDQRSGIGLIILLTIAFAALDVILVCGWNIFAGKTLHWIDLDNDPDWVSIFMLIGFVFGGLLVSVTGWRLPRYDFVRLVFLIHLIGTALQGLMILLPLWKSGPFYRVSEAREDTMVTVMGGMGIVFSIVLLWWGIAPITYLIAYRDYRRRMSLMDTSD
jgi:hypothetical protein